MRTPLLAASLLIAALAAALAIAQERTPSPPGARVFIITPKNGATVHNPFVVQFGLKGMTVAPAGTRAENSGHHHLLIDTDPPADMSAPLPTIPDKIVHFGKGQTETTLTLPPGKHTLQLEFADALHIPHNPPVISKKITITVAP
jgi:Domain of unknown function (DUF4399)